MGSLSKISSVERSKKSSPEPSKKSSPGPSKKSSLDPSWKFHMSTGNPTKISSTNERTYSAVGALLSEREEALATGRKVFQSEPKAASSKPKRSSGENAAPERKAAPAT